MVESSTPVATKKIIFDNYDCTVASIQMPMENLYVYQFHLEGAKQATFIAGQYMSLIVPSSTPAPFSIASSPVNKDMIELGIEITGGPHTSKIKELKVGDHVILRGPFGTFTIPESEKNVCFLAGGVGITPFMSMLRWIRDTRQDIHATLFYSCKVKQQFLWLDELEAMQQSLPHVKIVLTVTRENPEGWKHSIGRITPEMIKQELPDYMNAVFYSCGPPALIEAMFSMLKQMGVSEDKLKREKW